MNSKKVLILSDDKEAALYLKRFIDSQFVLSGCDQLIFPFKTQGPIKVHRPDILFLMVRQLKESTLSFIQKIKDRFHGIPLLMITKEADYLMVESALDVGVRGVVFEKDFENTLIHAIEVVLKGRIFLDEAVSTHVLSHLMSFSPSPKAAGINQLSDRELEVYGLIKNGCSIHEISEKLYITEDAVTQYRSRIKEKLNVDRF